MKSFVRWALKQKMVRALLIYGEHNGPTLADSITYRTLFGLFATVLLGFSAVSLWMHGDPQAIAALSQSLQQVIPGISEMIDVDKVAPPTGFTVAGLFSLGGLLVAAVGAINSLRLGLRTLADEAYMEEPPVRAYLQSLLVGVGLALLFGLATVASLGTSVGLGVVASWFGIDQTSTAFNVATYLTGLLIVFALDTAGIALSFRFLSEVPSSRRNLWVGSAIGGVGLLILQQFSGVFVKGAANNPLLASFAALIALLLWLNLSAQVVLIAGSFILVSTREDRTGAPVPMPTTMEEWKKYRASSRVAAARKALAATEDAPKVENHSKEAEANPAVSPNLLSDRAT